MPRLLLITPYFPPMSRVGAKRPLALARHLPGAGWEVVVLASGESWDACDPSLSGLIPPDLPIYRDYSPPRRTPVTEGGASSGSSRSARNQYLSPFDRFLAHVPRAVRAAAGIVGRHRPDVIAVCADPFSALYTGALVSRQTGLPLVADLRDPWALQSAKMALRPGISRWVVRASEAWCFRRARRIVLNTEEALAAHRQHYEGRIAPDRFAVVRNAFDAGQFDPVVPERPARFTVLHFGQFRLLVPAAPLLEAFARFVRARALSPTQATFAVSGVFRPEDQAHAERLGLAPYLSVQESVPFRQSMRALRNAHLLAFALDHRMELTIPAKLYDYLAARRPILALCDQPEAARIVRDTGSGEVADPADPEAGAAGLGRFYDRFLRDGLPDLDPARVTEFSAEAQARRFAAVLSEAAGS